MTSVVWYVQNPPDGYRGAQVMRNGLDDQYHFLTGAPTPRIVYTADARAALAASTEQEAIGLCFTYDEVRERYSITLLTRP